MDPITILTAFVPVLQDGVRALFNRFTGGAGARPANADEAIRMKEADVKHLEALAKLDSVGTTAQWVNNIRALMRPTVGLIIVGFYGVAIGSGAEGDIQGQLANLTASVVFYLFGDRSWQYARRQG